MTDLRSRMIDTIEHFVEIETGKDYKNLNICGRYGNFFYKLEKGPMLSKRLAKKIEKSYIIYDITKLKKLSDDELFNAYNMFMKRFCAQR